MSNTEPNPAWVSFCTEARRLSQLAVERTLAALPVFIIAEGGRIVGIGGVLFDCPQTENDPARS